MNKAVRFSLAIIYLLVSCLLGSCSLPQNGQHSTQLLQPLQARSVRNPAPVTLDFQPALLGKPYDHLAPKPFEQALGVGYSRKMPRASFQTKAVVPLPEPVHPVLECVRHNTDGSYTAFFGFQNDNNGPVSLPIGENNRFVPGAQDRGQPYNFAAGRTPAYPQAAFSVDFNGSPLVWVLNDRSVTASNHLAQRCADSPVTATPSPPLTGNQAFEYLDQAVFDKADELVASGQGHCVYRPTSFPQNGNCNSTSTGFQCSGALDKNIHSAQCPEIAIYGGAMNINHDLSGSKLFVSVQNNLTLNQSVNGILSTRGDLNTSLNNGAQLKGVFVGARSNNFNLSGNAKIEGLYAILNNGSLAMNLNPSAVFQGQLCTTGQANFNRSGNSQMIYDPNQVTPWERELPIVTALMCESGNRPYTHFVALTSPTPGPSPQPTVTPVATPSPSTVPTPTPVTTPTPVPTPTPTPVPTPTPTPLPSFEPDDEVVFDPADPESLGELFPGVPGNADTEAPQTSEVVMQVNGEELPPAAIGEVLIDVAEPIQTNLELIKQRYVGDVLELDAAEGTYLLKVNMRAIDLSNLQHNLQLLNAELQDPAYLVRNASFANLESARTFAVIVDLLASQLVKAADFNSFLEPSGDFRSVEGSVNLAAPSYLSIPRPLVPLPSPAPVTYSPAVENLWWLNHYSTNILQAWDYNLGYNYTNNEPVQVAVIDGGFAGISQLLAARQDLSGQLDLTRGFIDQQYDEFQVLVDPPAPWCTWCTSYPKFNAAVTPFTQALIQREDQLLCKPAYFAISGVTCDLSSLGNWVAMKQNPRDYLFNFPQSHGTSVISILASQLSNQTGTAGAAPHIQVIPVKIGQGLQMKISETVHALQELKRNPIYDEVDVINMSIGLSPTESAPFIERVIAGREGQGAVLQFLNAIENLANDNVVVVLSAGNDGVDARANFYTRSSRSIIVGASQFPPAGGLSSAITSLPGVPNPSQLTRSVWSSTFLVGGSGSNWSPAGSGFGSGEIAIYAPGSNVLVQNIDYQPLYGVVGGTTYNASVPVLDASNRVSTTRLWNTDGTSFAAPITAGVVAIMKGIKEDISPTDVKLALINTAFVNNYTDNNLYSPTGTAFSQALSLRILNAEAAVQSIYQRFNAGDGRMQSYFGTLQQSGDTYQLRLDANPSLVYNLQWGKTSSVFNLDQVVNLQIQDKSISPANFVPVASALSQRVQVEGQLRGSRLFVHQLSLLKVPPVPTGLTATSIQSRQFTLHWDAVPLATSYDILINGMSYATVTTPELLVQYFPSSPALLNPNSQYFISVRARNAYGQSAYSSAIEVTTLAAGPTPPPTCRNRTIETVVTNTAWRWSNGGTYIVNNPYFTPQIPGASPIWVSAGACNQCSYVIFTSYLLPSGWYVDRAYVDVQASQYADVNVRGRFVGQASYQNSVTPHRFDIDPAFFGQGGNNLTLSFLTQNFNLPRPAVLAKFSIERCQP